MDSSPILFERADTALAMLGGKLAEESDKPARRYREGVAAFMAKRTARFIGA